MAKNAWTPKKPTKVGDFEGSQLALADSRADTPIKTPVKNLGTQRLCFRKTKNQE